MKLISLALLSVIAASAQGVLFVDLSGEWRKSAHDKPIYARRNFDDSNWSTVRLPWPARPRGTYWLSRTVSIPAWADTGQLAITLGSVSEVYEVYANGVRIGDTGGVSFDRVPIARPRTFNLPANAVGKGGALRIAIRYDQRVLAPIAWVLVDSGPYLLTDAANAPRAAGSLDLNQRALRFSPKAVFAALEALIAGLVMLAWFAERQRYELLLFTLYLTLDAIDKFYMLAVISTGSHPWNRMGAPALETILLSLSVSVLSAFVLVALNRRSAWLHALLWLGWMPVPLALLWSANFNNIFFWTNIWAPLLALVVIADEWWRDPVKHHSRDAQLFLFVLLLPIASELDRFVTRLVTNSRHWEYWMMGPYRIERQDLTILVLASAVVVVLLRRLAADRRDRMRLAAEFEAARVVQHMMVSQSGERSATIDIDPVYRPAQEVGGDFYKVLEDENDARLLIVGDVSGKGLKAAMLVSLVMGALRTTKERPPATLLTELNHAVYGQTDGGFVTCCCAHVSAAGTVTLANAGHLSPYLSGREVEVPGGLPLGIAAEASYNETTFQLPTGERMVFLSDGIVEAANEQRELFGFERTRAISTQSATEIADAAQAFGQNDDITVVTVRRNGAVGLLGFPALA